MPVHLDPSVRVAVVYRLDHPGGVQSCALSLIRGLNRCGVIPNVLWDLPPNSTMLEKWSVQARYRPLRFRVSTRTIDRLPTSLRYLAWVANAVDGDKLADEYDFFYIFYNGFLVSTGVPHLRYLSGPPLLPQLEKFSPGVAGLPARFFRGLYQGVFRRWSPVYEVHPGSPYVINSAYTAGLFAEAHGEELPVVHPPIDLRGRMFDPGDLPRRDTLTFFSRVVPYKRPEMVLKLAARHPELRCVVMGGVPAHRMPYFQSLQETARSMGLPEVVFLANPTNERVREELARTRFYVFPAVNEHFGMATAEAVASGALPYVHDSGGQREVVPDPRLRFSDQEFVSKFDRLIALPVDELQVLRGTLAEYVHSFSEEVFIEKMLSYCCQ